MKVTVTALVALVVLGALALAGCGSGEDQKVTAQQVKKEAKEAVNTAVTYSKQKQDELIAQAQAQYQELEKETSQLMDKAKEKATAGQDKAKESWLISKSNRRWCRKSLRPCNRPAARPGKRPRSSWKRPCRILSRPTKGKGRTGQLSRW